MSNQTWTFDRNRIDGRPYHEVYCGEHTPENKVCEVASINHVPLIASVPDLLQELQACVRKCEDIANVINSHFPEHAAGLRTQALHARAALAKAEPMEPSIGAKNLSAIALQAFGFTPR